MSSCDHYRRIVPMFVDGELAPPDRDAFLAHVESCSQCQAALAEEQALSARVRQTRPQITAPSALRAEVERRMREAATSPRGASAPASLRTLPRRWAPLLTAAASLVLVAGISVGVYQHRLHGSDALIRAAVQTHESLESDSAPLEVVSDSPEKVAAWFSNKLPFPLQWANAGIAADSRAKYTLDGGKVLRIGKESAAFISFHIPQERVTMLVAPQHSVETGGSVVVSGGIALHSRNVGSVHVVTWNNRGLTYVLSANTSMGNPSTCGTCHQSSPTQETANR